MNIKRIVGVAAVVALQATMAVSYAYAGAVPLPEPTTLALVGIGAGIIAVGAWWKNRQK